MEIRSFAGIETEALYSAFMHAFADYDAPLPDQAAFQKMLKRRGYDPSLSFGAFENGAAVSFTFNGKGIFSGIPTAYDTGTGTIPGFRKKGLAKRIFGEARPVLVSAGIKQYLLEVLQHNSGAVTLYRSLGFEIVREFDYFHSPATDLIKRRVTPLPDVVLSEIAEPDIGLFSSFHDFAPSWQNSFEAIGRCPEDFIITTASYRGMIIGYGIVEPASGDITQIAVGHSFRRSGIASVLLSHMLDLNRSVNVKMINVDKRCHSLTGFAQSFGWEPAGSQYEMICTL